MPFEFQTRISRARISVPFDGPVMARVGEAIVRTVKMRISQAVDVNDNPAPPLKPGKARRQSGSLSNFGDKVYSGYLEAKRKRNIPAIRNWRFSGKLLNSMVVLSASPGKAVVGFAERAYNLQKGYATTNLVATVNQNRWPQFGLSPRDQQAVNAVLEAEVQPIVEISQAS